MFSSISRFWLIWQCFCFLVGGQGVVMSEEELELVVQTGNFVTPPKEDGTPGEWKVTQEWKIKAGATIT